MKIIIPENNVEVDVETLGQRPGCMVLSIGAVQFFPRTGKLGEEFYVNIEMATSFAAGLKLDTETLYWWLKQEKEAGMVLDQNKVELKAACIQFANWYKDHCNNFKMWSNWSAFDMPMMQAAFSAAGGIKFPTEDSHWNNMCHGTLKTLFPLDKEIKERLKPEGFVAHNALWDAKWQARCALHIFNRIGLFGVDIQEEEV